MLRKSAGFPFFDCDRNGRLDAKEWDMFRAMMASENGLLAIKLGGHGDMTASAVRWRYQRPVPQVPSTLLYGGVLFMVNDSGILLSIDPANGNVLKQGRLKGAIDKYFASPVGADGKVFLVSQDGTRLRGRRQGRLGDPLGQPARRRGVRRRRRSPTAGSTFARRARCTVFGNKES